MSFFSIADPEDRIYKLLQEAAWEPAKKARAHIESLWSMAASYLDEDLARKASKSLHPHYWELFTASALLEASIPLVPRSERPGADFGPDLLIRDPKCWIEAVAPTGGEGPDAVREAPLGVLSWVPHEEIKLRLVSALHAKLKARTRYLEAGLLSDADPFVVAINGAAIPGGRFEKNVPRILSALFPIGDEYITLNPKSLEVVGGGFKYAPTASKRSGATIRMDSFLSSEYAGVSAVIYGSSDALNFVLPPFSNGLITVHNPLARNPLPRHLVPSSRVYWAETATNTIRWD